MSSCNTGNKTNYGSCSDTLDLKEKDNIHSSQLTLEAIRTGLGLPLTDSKRCDGVQVIEPDIEPSVKQLFELCQELIELVDLLDKQRQDLVKECTEKNQVVLQFEALYDSLRDREIQFYDKMIHLDQKFSVCESKFNNLARKVTSHLEELQEERDRLAAEAFALQGKLTEINKYCEDLKGRIEKQKEAICSLRKGSHNMLSEKEVTDLSLRFRSLQNYNAQLLTDRTVLMLNLEELTSSLEHAQTEASSNLLSRVSLDHYTDLDLKLSYNNSLGESRGPVSHSLETFEKAVEQLRASISAQDEEYNRKFNELENERIVYERYKEALENMIARQSLLQNE